MSRTDEQARLRGKTLAELHARFRRDHTCKEVASGGLVWPYYALGAGDDAILMLHGGGGAGDVFFGYIDELATAFRIIAPSLPPNVTTVDAAIAGLVAILDREGIASTHVFGHSQGGFLAIAFSHRCPTRLRSLIIASSALPSPHHDRLVARHLCWLRLTPNFLLPWVMRFALQRLSRLGGNALTEDERRLLARFVPFDDASALRRWALSSGLLQRDYHRHEINEPRWLGPALLIEAGRDRLTSAIDAAALRGRYPQARVEHFADAGHLDLVLRPARYLRALRDFLASH